MPHRPPLSSDQKTSGRPAGIGRPYVSEGRTPADLDRFWTGYEPVLRGYAWHLVDLRGIPDGLADVDDVASQVYVKLRENWPTVRFPIAYARSWARVVVFGALDDEEHRGPALGGSGDDDQDDDCGGLSYPRRRNSRSSAIIAAYRRGLAVRSA
jgi:hypothetical protein